MPPSAVEVDGWGGAGVGMAEGTADGAGLGVFVGTASKVGVNAGVRVAGIGEGGIVAGAIKSRSVMAVFM